MDLYHNSIKSFENLKKKKKKLNQFSIVRFISISINSFSNRCLYILWYFVIDTLRIGQKKLETANRFFFQCVSFQTIQRLLFNYETCWNHQWNTLWTMIRVLYIDSAYRYRASNDCRYLIEMTWFKSLPRYEEDE